MMKDTQLRGIILAKYYERRRGQMFMPKPDDFDPPIPIVDILEISDQLGQHGLIEWKAVKYISGIADGRGKISAFGIDVVEGEATPDIKVEFVQNKSVNVTGSSNVVVGDHNHECSRRRALMSNNAFERTVIQRGPRLAAARSSWPAAQLDR